MCNSDSNIDLDIEIIKYSSYWETFGLELNIVRSWFILIILKRYQGMPETYPGLLQTSKMESFATIVNDYT